MHYITKICKPACVIRKNVSFDKRIYSFIGARSLVTTNNLRNQLHQLQTYGIKFGFRYTTSNMSSSSRSKPPNILVYAQEDTVSTNLVETLRDVIRVDTYTVYPITKGQLEARAWPNSTILLLVHGQVQEGLANVILEHFLAGGKLMAICSNLLRWVLPKKVKNGESEARSVTLSYERWQNVSTTQEIVQWIGDAKEYTEIVRNSAGTEIELKVEILARENTYGTPSILSIESCPTEGKGIFTQLLLNDNRSHERDILKHLLCDYLGISIKEHASQERIQYKNAFLLGSMHSIKNFLENTDSVLNLGNLELHFCNASKDSITSTETQLSVLTDLHPDDFSAEEYFSHLTTSSVGRIGIYCPTITSSMEIVSYATLSHGFVVIPRRQTRGNGRNNNRWLGPDGCAMFSLQLHVSLMSVLGQRLPIIQHLVAISVVDAIRGTPGYEHLEIGLKWPNDIYARGATKIGGLIINSQLCDTEAIVNVGCGVNLNNSSPTLCINDLIRDYNKLRETNLPQLGYEETLAKFFNTFEKLYTTIQDKDDLQALYDLYYKYWLHGDKSVNVKNIAGREVSGTVSGIDEYGYLLVKTSEDEKPICVHPDGNSFDMMKGLIIPKYF
ncbi:biotin--protein ligase isoform X2 [Armigeres subalbatus]|uniref:biotin--protein ligase isoform X2 n=1 Tax=Armigeres subalbatus TaxID=124917 RepID=UPI002ED3DF2E